MILALFMAAILPNLKIDSDATISKYFMPHQVRWMLDEEVLHRDGKQVMAIAEKSVRIGWTEGDAFKNVRKRLRYRNRDYLFCTRDYPSALDYMQRCKKYADLFNFTKSIVSHGEESITVDAYNEDGEKAGFTEEVKMGVIKFDNGSHIRAFSASPGAMAVYGGDVGGDEFAKAKQATALYEIMQGRVTWGFDLALWSAHLGTDTLFYQFAMEAQQGKGPWNLYYKVTMADAIELGLVEKINEVSGTKFTREQFLEACRQRARLEEIFQQAYMCNPMGGNSTIVPWRVIEACMQNYEIERWHLEGAAIPELFGEFTSHAAEARATKIAEAIKQRFQKLLGTNKRHSLGFDVAASRQGDMAAIYLDELAGDEARLAGLLTCRTEDWAFLKAALWTFMRFTPAVKGAGDETGLGRQICWETEKEFPGQFVQVNFSSSKSDMGTRLMNELAEVKRRFPKGHPDIAQDFFALRKHYAGSKLVFSEGTNVLNPHSHCDIAWGGGLSSEANANQGGIVAIVG